MTTTSTAAAPTTSLGPNALLPVVMRTRAIPSPNPETPRKERPLFAVGAKNVPREAPFALKYWMEVVLAKSTSANTAPNPATVAGTAPPVPGMENVPSVMLLPSGVKRRTGLNVTNVVA